MSPSLTAMMDEGRADLALFLGRAFTLTKRREGRGRKEESNKKTKEREDGKEEIGRADVA